jgi:hypothetical protein
MTLGSYFYIEYLGIEVWSYFRGWQESMTGIYLIREIGMHLLVFTYFIFFKRIKAQCLLPYVCHVTKV